MLTTATFFFLLPYIAIAIPVNPDSIDTSASVLLCSEINYNGICTQHATPLGNNNCNSIDGDSSTVKSIKTDDDLDCIFYSYVNPFLSSDAICVPTQTTNHSNGVCRTFLDPAAESLTVHSPGNADLAANSGWTRPLLSYTCVSVKTTEYAKNRQGGEEGENERRSV
ncbi:uncharacterized protein LTHEOB_7268 [Lasiodiplodia theobromae]|uniref:Secreted protein n=1 Tax=Lasiodiplodia theobromae TaxID=45133 RepID=A0A5N5DPH7_9PEZI|nr:uncharacterized protein LTHEOB_7268 [Lasiodiplodia theobromae]KAB2579713.1 hypothetical protein DBV05_g1586 [Lasiodiplodia theobromae]KAF4543014.1 hypothetical protein LTHEOB_7268 [Lasiodiplodia theobromae]